MKGIRNTCICIVTLFNYKQRRNGRQVCQIKIQKITKHCLQFIVLGDSCKNIIILANLIGTVPEL